MKSSNSMFSLAFYDDGEITYTSSDENKCQKSKLVCQDDIMKVFQNSIIKEEYVYRLGDIPKHYQNAFILNDKSFCLIQYLPKGKYPLATADKAMKIWYPDLLFCWMVKDQKLRNSYVFAIDGPLEKNSQIYKYPFSNVYEDGHICWGANHFNNFKNLKSLENMPYIFFTAPSNFDLIDSNSEYTKILNSAKNGLFELKKFSDGFHYEALEKQLYIRFNN